MYNVKPKKLFLEICKSILYEDVKSIILIRLRDLSQTSGVILFVVVILIDDLAAFKFKIVAAR